MSVSRLSSGSNVSAASAASLHPEAINWIGRVASNSGTVNNTTVQAVSAFCFAIDSAGIRDRFYRFNFFSGDSGLSSALVPLYRGPSLSGTQFGNATETNNNFVSGDSTAAGLAGNGTTKFLRTGIAPGDLGTNIVHLSASAIGTETTGSAGTIVSALATYDGSNAASFYAVDWINVAAALRGGYAGSFAAGFIGAPYLANERHMLASRTTNSLLTLYRFGVPFSTQTSTGSYAASTREFYVYALNNNGTAQRFTACRMQSYSIGLSMTDAQCQSFYSALNTLYLALGR